MLNRKSTGQSGLTELVGTQQGPNAGVNRGNSRDGGVVVVLLRELVSWDYSAAVGSS